MDISQAPVFERRVLLRTDFNNAQNMQFGIVYIDTASYYEGDDSVERSVMPVLELWECAVLSSYFSTHPPILTAV